MIRAANVAEVIVTVIGGGRIRGSGYRVGTTTVLTAAHVLDRVESVRVRFDADRSGEWTADVVSWFVASDADIAVLTIEAADRAVGPARFGKVGDRDAVLGVRAVGFPLWKLKKSDDGRTYRDTHDAVGSVAVLSNRREDTLEITVAAPGHDPDPDRSPWEGMSGAAVWAGNQIVGVVTRHYRRDGLGRLTAARIDRALTNPDLRALLDVAEISDVTDQPYSKLGWTAYHRQVVDIAPEQLRGRGRELDELTEFCASARSFAWWQASPWVGKSALMSWFVLHPPAGVDVVSFFVTGRLAGQADSDAYLDALLEQLAALTDGRHAEVISDRHRRLGQMIEDAAVTARGLGRRIVLVVDGLDEDVGQAAGKPSIASTLPLKPPPEVRVIVASRPNPPLPDDVGGDHPLRSCEPRELAPSEFARHIELNATYELNRLLTGTPVQVATLGFITASGGGLTSADLQVLTGLPPYVLDRLLGSVFGRTVGERDSAHVPDRVHLFTHETLRAVAEQKFGPSAESFRHRIMAWANDFRDRGWPPDTPVYLLRGYVRMLAEHDRAAEVMALATDKARHQRMLELPGGSYLVDDELRTAKDLMVRRGDLTALLALCTRRAETRRHADNEINHKVPAVWAALGEVEHAEALARTIGAWWHRDNVLVDMALAMGAASRYDRAAALLTSVTYQTGRQLLSRLVDAAARRGHHDGVHTLLAGTEIRDIEDPNIRAHLYAALAEATPEPEGARAVLAMARAATAEMSKPYWRAKSFARVAEAAFALGDHDSVPALLTRAESLARAIKKPERRPRALARLATALATVGLVRRARQVLAEADDACAAIARPDHRGHALAAVAEAATEAGDHDRTARVLAEAETLVPAFPDPDWLVTTMARLVPVADAVHGQLMLADAEARARTIGRPYKRARALTAVARAAAATGDRARATHLVAEAERIASAAGNPALRDEKLAALVRAAAIAGADEDAETLLDKITDPDHRIGAAITFAVASPDRASALLAAVARVVPARYLRVRLLVAIGVAGHPSSSRAAEREAADDPVLLAELVLALVTAGELAHAETVAAAVADPTTRDRLLELVSRAYADARDFVRAVALSPRVPDVRWRAPALAAEGEYAAAEQLLGELAPIDRAVMLVELANAAPDPTQAEAWLTAAVTVDERIDWDAYGEVAARMADVGEYRRTHLVFGYGHELRAAERAIPSMVAARDAKGLLSVLTSLADTRKVAPALIASPDLLTVAPIAERLTADLLDLDWTHAVLFVAIVDPAALLAALPDLTEHADRV